MASSGRIEIDHYVVLGLPSGERGAKLSDQEIKKAFQSKAMVMHPDKRRHDPNAHANFLNLHHSYEILKDSKSRKAFDDLLGRERVSVRRCEGQPDPKRRKMKSDLEEAERRSAAAGDFGVKQSREEDERYARVLNSEIARIIARHNKENHEAAADRTSKQAAAAAKDRSRFNAAQNNDNNCSWFATATPQDFDNYVLERIRRIKEIAKSRSGQ